MDLVSNKVQDILRDINYSVSFEIIHRYDSCIEDLNDGNIDILIGNFDGLSNNIYQLNVGEIEYGIFAGKENSLLNKDSDKVSLRDLYNEKFLGFKYHGKLGEEVERFLNNGGKRINTVVSYSQYSLVASSLVGSDFLALLPVGLVDTENLFRLDLDECLPKGKCYIYWHSIMENDRFHKYLRNCFYKESLS